MNVQGLEGGSAPVVELFSGIDSLYLSGRTAAPPRALLADLANLRVQSIEAAEPVLLNLGAATFQVAPAGFGRYRYRLDHRHGVLAMTDSASLPTFRIQPRAEFLHGVGPTAAVAWWFDVLRSVAVDIRLSASRLDVCADFHGLDLHPEDRDRFMCPSTSRDEYTRGGLSAIPFS